MHVNIPRTYQPFDLRDINSPLPQVHCTIFTIPLAILSPSSRHPLAILSPSSRHPLIFSSSAPPSLLLLLFIHPSYIPTFISYICMSSIYSTSLPNTDLANACPDSSTEVIYTYTQQCISCTLSSRLFFINPCVLPVLCFHKGDYLIYATRHFISLNFRDLFHQTLCPPCPGLARPF